jgi:hypothetical protein
MRPRAVIDLVDEDRMRNFSSSSLQERLHQNGFVRIRIGDDDRHVDAGQCEIRVCQKIDGAWRVDERVMVAHEIDGGEAVSVDWPAAAGTAPEPPEAADARAWINAVLPAPVGPTTAIALTMLLDLFADIALPPLRWGGAQRRAPLLAYVRPCPRPVRHCFTNATRRQAS